MIIKEEELEFKERMLDLVNSLNFLVTDYSCDGDICEYVCLPANDAVVKEIFKRCGFTDKEYESETDNGQIDLNLIGFKYGNWWNSEEGYSYSETRS